MDDTPNATLPILLEDCTNRGLVSQIDIMVFDPRGLDILRRRVRRQLVLRDLLEALVYFRVRVVAVIQGDNFVAARLLQYVCDVGTYGWEMRYYRRAIPLLSSPTDIASGAGHDDFLRTLLAG